MALRISGKNMSIGDALRTHVRTRIDMAVAKFSTVPLNGHVTIEPEGSGYRAECTLHFGPGMTLQVEAEAHDVYASFNRAFDRIEERLRRSKRRSRTKHSGVIAHPIEFAPSSAEKTAEAFLPEDEYVSCPAVIAEPPACLKEMSVSTAVLQLDGSDMPLVMFRHAKDGHPSIVYRRSDGNIGWIDSIVV
jgi:ribosomal subunit interface protein